LGAIFFLIKLAFEYLNLTNSNMKNFQYELLSKTFLNY
jgi:hypothetical protein